MTTHFRLHLRFWGVRGSIPTPQKENLHYGGNTLCVELRLPTGEIFIFDGGSGLRRLGDSLAKDHENQGFDVRLFLTHFHWDHIQGIPFFQPLYLPENTVSFHALRFPEAQYRRSGSEGGLEETLKGQMGHPYFPVSFDFLHAKKNFIETDLEPIKFGKLTITPFPLNHPGHTYGYRIESEGAVIVYATDLEHGDEELDKVLRDHSQNADLLIFDSQYTPQDYEAHKGWGHSTWLEACQVAKEAKVKQLALFHHEPSYHDQQLDQIVEKACREFENTLAAQEGWSIVL
ncbi:MBL fold metallo-hydrolase [Acidobacteria bacterium AH-259-D05]|nr:MBL fold metallo-hydrolase [Acidobacteria bacterium AH-259-D05]